MEIKTKYNIGDTIWFCDRLEKIICGTIENILIMVKTSETDDEKTDVQIYYIASGYTRNEILDDIFPTKEELINHLKDKAQRLTKPL